MPGVLQDLTRRIMNVSWGGGVFVAGRGLVFHVNPCAIVYGKPAGTEIDWKPLGALGIGDGGYLIGCSAGGLTKQDDGTTTGKTVFVAVGQTFEEPNYGSITLTSADGQDWKVTRKKMNVTSGGTISIENGNGVVWDEDDGAFYAAFYAQENGSGFDVFSERIYKSSDGLSWGLVEEASFIFGDNPDLLPDSLLLKHCKKPENVGGKDPAPGTAKMPDGLQAYNKGSDVFIKPKDLKRFNSLGPLYDYQLLTGVHQPTSTVHIRRPDDEGTGYTQEDVSIPDPCFAVAIAGGTWVAGGGKSKMDMSTDNGKTWDSSYTHSGDGSGSVDILTIVGGKPDKSGT